MFDREDTIFSPQLTKNQDISQTQIHPRLVARHRHPSPASIQGEKRDELNARQRRAGLEVHDQRGEQAQVALKVFRGNVET